MLTDDIRFQLKGLVHNQPIAHFKLLFVVLAQIHRIVCMWPSVPHSENIAPMLHFIL